MKDTVNVMMQMIQSCILSEEYRTDGLTEQDLIELYRLSRAHDLSHLIAHMLSRTNALPESGIGKQYDHELMKAVFRCTRMDAELRSVCEVLEQNKICYLPLKGSVIRGLYPEPWMRTSCDIDILVHENDLNAARDVIISKLGYRVERENYHDIPLYSPSGVHLELHFTICENMQPMDCVLSKAWEYASPASDGGCKYVFSNEYLMFHHVAHAAYHFYAGGCGIRPLIDIWLMKNKLTMAQDKLTCILKDAGLKRFYDAIFSLISVWFESGKHSALTIKMQKHILTGGIYGVMENAVLVKRTKEKKGVKYLLRRLFPPLEHMRERNKILKRCPVLLPFFWIARIFSGLSGQNSQRAKREIQTSNSISATQIAEMEEMLTELGLLNN